ncbi:MAG: GGDEF domain-containing protein [Gammaproteobacteria bacterium]
MSTPQLLETGRHKDSNTLNLVLRPFAELTTASNDEFSAALRLNTVLQTTLDIGALIKLFADELIILMPFDGFSYRNSARDIDITFGKAARHKCSYRLIVGEENLGEVTLSRRRKFQDREIELARRHRTPLSLIVMDIDKFKSINDTYGHTTGDEIIKTFTKVVGRIIRKTDMLFRYGGEEFVVIMSNTGRDGSMLLAERIRRGIEKMDVLLPQYHLPVTVSLGVASLKLREDGKSLFKRADQALYQAKASGRNCVCLADSTSAYS